ncbi:MAG: hypothetical protein IKI67_06595 [Bacteroidales bacterium]|nr:hypothetical protein [Bacteroidales bacterium]
MEKSKFSKPLDENLATSIRKYINMQIDRAALNGAERISWVSNKAIVTLIMIIAGGLFILMLSFALGYYLGEVFGSIALGFLCSAGSIALLTLIIFLFRKKLFANQMAKMNSKMLLGNSKMSNMKELHLRQQLIQSQIESKENDIAAEYQLLKNMLNPLNYIGKFVNMIKEAFSSNSNSGKSGKSDKSDTPNKEESYSSDYQESREFYFTKEEKE